LAQAGAGGDADIAAAWKINPNLGQ